MKPKHKYELCFDKHTGELFGQGLQAFKFYRDKRQEFRDAGRVLIYVTWNPDDAGKHEGFDSKALVEDAELRVEFAAGKAMHLERAARKASK